ncbi:MAG TPA: hypothetical protein VHX13_05740 [Acidobacteriaceae bacterium]|jgi:uncharacterized membrane protein YagU involved in acid resistance|nr:hypothetical protein [Acidobacteriaceae bacterium]
MNWSSWLLWGFVATVALTTLSAGAQGAGLTRMSFPDVLGLAVTPSRDKAKIYGFLLHGLLGLVYSLIYVAIFESLHEANWWIGALIGLAHALFVLVVVMKLLPSVHPRMASERYGPTAKRMLEPPGFLALHYGVQTPLAILVSHLAFGVILGAFYHLH